MTNLDACIKVLKNLKRGDCWCEVGIDNPNMGGRHSQACLDAKRLSYNLDLTLQRSRNEITAEQFERHFQKIEAA